MVMRASLLFASALAAVANAAAPEVFRGVNLGGWLVTEPWMTPTLYNSTGTNCEWNLCNALGKEACLSTLQNHWSTFYTHDDFLGIKAAGLSTPPQRQSGEDAVRIPLGYWAVTLEDYEPYVSGQYPYLIQAVNWCNELGLSVFIDLHGAPGSQNGWEETGIVGAIEFPANTTNSNRSLEVLTNLTTEFTKPQYGGAVTNIELLNEPIFDVSELRTFYTAGYDALVYANSTINVTIHDAFYNPPYWKNYDPNNADASSVAPYLTVDTHQFWAFAPFTDLNESQILADICSFGQELKAENSGIPPTLVGEWSLSTGITANSTGNTEEDQVKRTWFRMLFEAEVAAFTPNGAGQASIGWFMWAWKTEYDIDAWSYQRGVSDGYIPSNISDRSTYAFPLLENGCIDTTHNYTAPATATFTTYGQGVSSTSASSSSTATGKSGSSGSSTSSGSSSSSSAKSSKSSATAPSVSPVFWVMPFLAIAPFFFLSVL